MDINLLSYSKELLGSIAVLLTFIAFIPYIRSILSGHTRPHVFSWIIWGITTLIVFFAQVADDGGAGTWSIGISGLITGAIAVLAYVKKSDASITKMDWVFFVSALAAIPFWYITSDPLYAVILLTTIDIVGFLPTIRKAYIKPFEEQIWLYAVMALRNFISIAALEHYSIITVLFPLAVGVACIMLIVMLLIRRRGQMNDSLEEERP